MARNSGHILYMFLGSQGSRSFVGPHKLIGPGSKDGVGSPSKQNAREEAGPPKKPKTSSLSPPRRVAQRPALIRISKFRAHVAPGALGGFARPGPLRTIPGLLEHGHPVPGSQWPPLLPIRGDRSKLALWDRVSG